MGCKLCYNGYNESSDPVILKVYKDPYREIYNMIEKDARKDLLLWNKIHHFIITFNKGADDKLVYNAYLDKQVGILSDFMKYNKQINNIHGVIKSQTKGVDNIHRTVLNKYEFHHLTNDPLIHEMIVNEVTRLQEGFIAMNTPVALIDNKFIEKQITQYKDSKYAKYSCHDIISMYNKYLLFTDIPYLIQDVISYIKHYYICVSLHHYIMFTYEDIMLLILALRKYQLKNFK